jgi:hypothetical protein
LQEHCPRRIIGLMISSSSCYHANSSLGLLDD